MVKLLIYIIGVAALAALFDLVGRRVLARGECGLHRALVLRDTCVGRCAPGQDCREMASRPYLFGGRQASACGCSAERLGRRPLAPPLGEEPPIDGDLPAPPRRPEREREDV